MRRRATRVGDIVEVKTPKGLAYLQYTHDRKGMGELVRILPGLFAVRPADFAQLANQRDLYFVFYTLRHALKKRLVEVASHQPIPEWVRQYPLMRWPARSQSGIIGWKIFSAADALTRELHQRTPVIRTLSPQLEELSIHQLWPHPVMVSKLAGGWTPKRAGEFRLRELAKVTNREMSQISRGPGRAARHFLYFPNKQDADCAGERLRTCGVSVEIRKSAGDDWLVLGTKDSEAEQAREEMEALAAEFHGEYDGWEMTL